jgi:hypothetical protein
VEVDTGSTISIPESAGWTNALDFNADGSLLAGASLHGDIGVWSSSTGEPVAVLEGHGDRAPVNVSVPTERESGEIFTTLRVNDLAWRPAYGTLISAGFDGSVREWDLVTGRGTVLHQFEHEAYNLAISPDGERLVAIDRSGTTVEIDLDDGGVARRWEKTSSALSLVFSPDGRFLAGAGQVGALLWDAESGRIVRDFEGSVYRPSGVVFTGGGSELLVASGEGVIRGYHLDPVDLVELAREKVSRELTEEECQEYLRRSCDG